MVVERARPLLGTIVRIKCGGLSDEAAHGLIDAAFTEIAHIHRLMSFHDPLSDVSRLNSMAASRPVRIDSLTFALLEQALQLSAASRGGFDISLGERMVREGYLPAPASMNRPDPAASWRDIELIGPDMVRFHRPLWIDLSGIAKGYAVDRAIEAVVDDSSANWCVNAGGDLRVAGPIAENIVLHATSAPAASLPMLRLENASVASSGGLLPTEEGFGRHFHASDRRSIDIASFVSVVAPCCVFADALTKVVLACAEDADDVLKAYGATAFLYRPATGWARLGAGS